MAVRLVSMALDSPYKPTPKLVLVVLSDFANDQGVCFPSRRTLKNKASIGKTTLNYILDAFEYIDLLKRKKQKRPNGSDMSSLYFIQVEKLFTLSNIENAIKRKYQIDEDLTDEEKKELNKKIEQEIGEEKNKYFNEYLHAYNEVRKSKGRSQGDLPHKVSKNPHVTTRGHGGDHLEPSDNHQEISKDISSSKKRRESFVDFKERIINLYSGYPILKGPKINNDLRFIDEVVISISIEYLHNDYTNKDLDPEDAKKIWKWMFLNQEKLLPIKKEETA